MPKPPSSLLRVNFQRQPPHINVASHGVTRSLADRYSAHPFHIRTVRRLADFDASTLHWKISVPVDLSKSAYIRDRTKRRLREAIATELRERGWERDGTVREAGGKDGIVPRKQLSGAVGILVNKDPAILHSSGEDIREAARWVVQQITRSLDSPPRRREKPSGSPAIRRKHEDETGQSTRHQAEAAKVQGWNVQNEGHG